MGALLLLLLTLLHSSSAFNSILPFSTSNNQQCQPLRNKAASTSSVCINLAASSSPNNNNNNNNIPGTELFPTKGSSYVPFGLTEQQYKQIKQEEEQQKLSKNYGAWGPRFAQSKEAPDGDWMVMPSLWTHGFKTRNQSEGAAGIQGGDIDVVPAEDAATGISSWQEKIGSIRRHAPAYLVSYLMIDAIFIAISLARIAKLSSSSESIFATALKMMLWKKQKMLILGIWKMKLFEFTAALCLVRPVETLVERTNRQWLWSPRRTMGIMLLGCVLLLSSWVTTLAFLG